jgi:very-short-patch-repair endonuclease
MMKRTGNPTIIKARELRRTMSLPEGLLWQELRKRPGGFKFRRQHPILGLIADFYCPAAKLVIEVDGEAHDRGERAARDERRDRDVAQLGLRTMRVPAAAVLSDPAETIAGIIDVCSA